MERLKGVFSPGLHAGEDAVDPVVDFGGDDGQMGFQVGRGGWFGEAGGCFEFGEEEEGEEGVCNVVYLRAVEEGVSDESKYGLESTNVDSKPSALFTNFSVAIPAFEICRPPSQGIR